MSRLAGTRKGLLAFTVVALLLGNGWAHSTKRDGAVGSANTAAAWVSPAALHSVPGFTVTLAPRSATRVPVLTSVALPASARDSLPATPSGRYASARAGENPAEAVIARGYDATAPPALS